MTTFENWCKANGYNPKGEFEVIEGLDSVYNLGDILTIARDDYTDCPWFNGASSPSYRGVQVSVDLWRLTQHKPKEEPMTENTLPIPRMVEVRDHDIEDWKQKELLTILADNLNEFRYIVKGAFSPIGYRYMREIEPEPEKPYMTPRQLLDAIRGGAVWRSKTLYMTVRAYWDSAVSVNSIGICYDWHGDESDIWEEARVK